MFFLSNFVVSQLKTLLQQGISEPCILRYKIVGYNMDVENPLHEAKQLYSNFVNGPADFTSNY